MGGSLKPVLHNPSESDRWIAGEDEYVRNQRLKGPFNGHAQKLLEPIWKFRSTFNDAMTPMEEGLAHAISVRCRLDTESVPDENPSPDHHHSSFRILLEESVFAANLYLTFANKLRKLSQEARIHFRSICRNREEMMKKFIEEEHPDAAGKLSYASKILFVMEMGKTMVEALESSLSSAEKTCKTSMENLKEIGSYYYNHKVPLPTEDALTRNFLRFHWHRIDEKMISEIKSIPQSENVCSCILCKSRVNPTFL